MKNKVCFIFGSGVSLLMDALFGGFPVELKWLMILMLIDIAFGIANAVMGNSGKSRTGRLSSDAMHKGLAKKIMTLGLIAVCHIVDMYAGITYCMNTAILSFMLNEIISIMETAAEAGIKVEALEKVLDVLEVKKGDNSNV